ncbi:MAG TPA: hypothetical protein VGC63_01240 [Solirubrobacterales bacterium]
MGVEAHLGSDLSVGVRAALADYTRRLGSASPPLEIPRFANQAVSPARTLDLSVSEETSATLEREAMRQSTTVSALAAHSVLVYLAEVDRLTPLNAA